MELPIELSIAIEEQLTSLSTKRLAAFAAKLSESYRVGRPLGGENFIRTYNDVLAYAVFRLPATFAAVYFAMAQAKERLPGFNPRTLLDMGAGPGTAMWAAAMLWPQLEQITLIEQEQHMIDLGKKLVEYSNKDPIRESKWIKADIANGWKVPPHDVVVASYVLNELRQDYREDFIPKLWENTGSLLIVIEPGTPAGFLRVNQVREKLLSQGAHVISPCPHNEPCPIIGNDWCHFSQRVTRTRLHRQMKGGKLSYEDEKFSFVCMSRTRGTSVEGVVVRHPQIKKGHIYLRLCTPEGIIDTVVTRRESEKFKEARELRWGSVVRFKI